MRPLQLTLRGFQSYADAHTFDFGDRSLLGIVGPIGSGKSSLLDAIAFALYGRTPRAGATTRDLINQRVDTAHVELWFEVEGQVWQAVRALRRKGQSAHNLYRRQVFGPDAPKLEEVSGERAVTGRVNELLGLEFDGFNRSVFLAQNRFAEFLHSRPGDRDRVLKGVFGFDRIEQMAEVAKARRDELKGQLAELERLRDDVKADREALKLEKPALAETSKRVAALDGAAEQVATVQETISRTEAERQTTDRRLVSLSELAAELPRRNEAGQLLDRMAEAEKGLATATEQVATTQAEVDQRRQQLSDLVSSIGTVDDLAVARELLAARSAATRRVDDAEAELVEVGSDLERLAAAAGEAATGAEAAAQQAKEAEAAVGQADEIAQEAERAAIVARHEVAAAALRSELHDGDECPVCRQVVERVPLEVSPPRLKEAEKRLADAREALTEYQKAAVAAVAAASQAGAEASAAAAAQARAEQRAEVVRGRLQSAQAELGAVDEKVRSLIPGDDPETVIAERASQHEAAARAFEDATSNYRKAVEAESAKQAEARQIQAQIAALAAALATLGGRLGVQLAGDSSVEGLQKSLATLYEAQEEQVAGEQKRLEAMGQALADARGELARLYEDLQVPEGVSFAEARRDAAAAAARHEERVAALEQRVSRFEELKSRSQQTTAELAVYERLAADLLPSGFLKYILEQERRGLAALGSEHLENMTGRYRFTDDGEFNIVDLNAAEAVRKVESLSGGETFLASLALALALAEMVTRDRGRLDSFFLDEGFGSLDPEHLALAMEGIERLVAGDRLVAVVSHVPELRERVEDLIVLEKEPLTGNTVVVRG